MSSSDSQRPPPRNELQRRLSSQPPAPGQGSRESSAPEWRSQRIAELAAAEAEEYAKVETRSSRPEAIMRVGSRAASSAAHGLASASVSTARLTAAGARGALKAALFAIVALGRGLLRLLDALGGAVIALLRALGRGSLTTFRNSGRALDVVGAATARASAASAVVASATGNVAARGLAQSGSALWSARRRLLLGLGAIAVATAAFVAYSSYATLAKTAAGQGGSRFQTAMIALGAELHATLVDLQLADPIPVAADKPEPPPHVARYALEVVSIPEGATASFAGQELPTPATFELDALPEPPLRVVLKKPGLATVVKRLNADDFRADGARLRHSLRVTLHTESTRPRPGHAPAAETSLAPDAPLVHAELDAPAVPMRTASRALTPIPTRVRPVPGSDAPAAPF